MTVDELLAVINSSGKPQSLPALVGAPMPQEQAVQEEPSDIGDFARGLARGAAKGVVGFAPRVGALAEDAFYAIPRVAERLATGSNEYLGPQWNRSSKVNQALDYFADMGVNRPQSTAGRYTETGADFVAGTATGGAVAKGLTGIAAKANPGSTVERSFAELVRQNANNPALQMVGSGAAGLTSQALDEYGYTNPLMRMLAPMAAGVVTSGAASGGKNVYDRYNVGKALDTPEGLRRAGGTILRDIAANPNSAEARLARSTGYIPGVTPTGPSASRDSGLMAVAPQLENYAAGNEVSRQANNAAARTQYIQNQLGARPGSDAPFYRAMDNAVDAKARIMEGAKPVNVSPLMDYIRKIDAPDESQKAAVTAAKNLVMDRLQSKLEPITGKRVVGQQPSPQYDANGTLVGVTMKDIVEDVPVAYQARPGQLLALKQDISDALTSNEGAGEKYVGVRNARRELTQVLSKIDDLIEEGAPGYKSEFRDAYSAAATGKDRLAYIRDIVDRSAASGPDAAGNVQLSPPKFLDQMRASRAERRRPDAGRMTMEGLSGDQRNALNRLYMDMAQENLINQRGVRASGSNTARNLTFDERIKELSSNAENPFLKALPAALPATAAGAATMLGAGAIPTMMAVGGASGVGAFLKNMQQNTATRRADALRSTLGEMYTNPDALRQGLSLARQAPVRPADPITAVPGLLGSAIPTISDMTEEKKKKKRSN